MPVPDVGFDFMPDEFSFFIGNLLPAFDELRDLLRFPVDFLDFDRVVIPPAFFARLLDRPDRLALFDRARRDVAFDGPFDPFAPSLIQISMQSF